MVSSIQTNPTDDHLHIPPYLEWPVRWTQRQTFWIEHLRASQPREIPFAVLPWWLRFHELFFPKETGSPLLDCNIPLIHIIRLDDQHWLMIVSSFKNMIFTEWAQTELRWSQSLCWIIPDETSWLHKRDAAFFQQVGSCYISLFTNSTCLQAGCDSISPYLSIFVPSGALNTTEEQASIRHPWQASASLRVAKFWILT